MSHTIEDGVYHFRTEYGWDPYKIKICKEKGYFAGTVLCVQDVEERKKKGVNWPLDKPGKRLKNIGRERNCINDL
jgi:hypothetical protein